jgi:hypothetical protein
LLHKPLVIPGPWAILRHAWPKILEGKVIPVLLFIGFLDLLGTTGALLSALGWSVSVIIYRMSKGMEVPGLVIFTTVGLAAKTILALATGSLVVYFLQPTIATALVGFAFLASVPLKRPLAAKLAKDFCPFDAETAEHPMLQLFFLRLSLLWAFTSLVNAAFTMWLLLTQDVTTFVLIKSFTGPTFTAVTLGIAGLWFRRKMRSQGLSLVFGKSMAVSAG